MALLAVNNLSVEFVTPAGRLRAVDGVSFALNEGEVLGLVGESGSGKTVACRSFMRLLPSERARIAGGEALFEGRDLLRENEASLRQLRGKRLAMIFQNPSTHLDPLMTIGRQVAEPLRYHEGLPPREALTRAIELLRLVGIPDPSHNAGSYPHQLSGGMRQRAMIAAAIACQPRLLVADEPTTALDVTVQAQILRLLLELRDRSGLAIILISHDLGVIASTCDRVAVMYAGRIMEQATKPDLLRQPRHPYTAGLVASRPSDGVRGSTLQSIKGQLPALSALPPGCRFHPRCPHAREVCRSGDLQPVPIDATRATACIRWPEVTGAT
jgi:peptide/nickel transport system ATP-binding protein